MVNPDENPQPFTFLVMSDIHFGELADSPEFSVSGKQKGGASSHRPSRRDGLVATVAKLTPKPTALFVPGDLTSIASPAEFKGCVDVTLGIADELGISRDNVFFTYGNHDTNWRICDLATETPRFQSDPAYSDVAATLGSLYAPLSNCVFAGPILGSGVFQSDNCTLFVVNSGYYCVAEQSYRHGRIGSDQLIWLGDAMARYSSSAGWKILMVHHHPFNYTYPTPIEDVSCIEEGADIVDLAARFGIDMLCHGHRHHPRLFTDMRTGWASPITFFCAGSVAVNAHHRDSGLVPNLFHVVSLKRRLSNGGAFGNVTTFEFTTDGWKPVRDCSATPLDHVHWFGSLATRQESEKAVREFLAETLRQVCGTPVMLPQHSALPPELMCCRLGDLNSLLTAIAPDSGFRVVGKYPEPVALIKM